MAGGRAWGAAFAAIRLAVTAACCSMFLAATAFPSPQQIIGVWYEESWHRGPRIISTATIRADGTVTALFRTCTPQGQGIDTFWQGRWTYANGLLRIAILNSAGQVTGVDEYQTESFDGRIWVYRLISGPGFNRVGPVRFRDTRVTAESRLPTCQTVS